MPEVSASSVAVPLSSLSAWSSRPNVQAAARNFLWLAAEKSVRLIFGMVVGFWLARHLGPSRLGTLGYCLALTTLLGIVPTLGLEAIVRRDLLQVPRSASELLLGSLLLRLGAGALTYLGVLVAVAGGWGLTGEERRLLAILGVMLFQPAFSVPDFWLQVHLRAKLAVLVQLAALVLCSGARVWLILSNASLAAFAWMVVIEMTLVAIGITVVARRTGMPFVFPSVPWAAMKRLLAEAWPLMFANLAIIVYMKIDEVMLRHLVGAAAVGVYSSATRLSEVWYFLPMALAASVLPALVRAKAGDPEAYRTRLQHYFDLSAGVAYALSIPIALAAPWIVRVAYGAAFVEAGPILAVHIWASIFVFLGVARSQWLVNENLQRFYLAATLAGAVANVGLNLVFIPRWGGLGAAWATVISYALAGWVASYFHPRVRATAGMQTRALFVPFRSWQYLTRR